jgi:hypothetical protein
LRVITAKYHREFARLFLLWAAEARNPVVSKQLTQRAQECLIAADALDVESLGRPPTQQPPHARQQQQ